MHRERDLSCDFFSNTDLKRRWIEIGQDITLQLKM